MWSLFSQIAMEGGESPLDVLSRAATMVQENQALNGKNCYHIPQR